MSNAKAYYTVGDVAELYDVPGWKVRRVVDSLDGDVPRAGQSRIIDRPLLGRVAAELERTGWFTPSQPEACNV